MIRVLLISVTILVLSSCVSAQTARVILELAKLRGTLEKDGSVEIINQQNARFLSQSIDYVRWLHRNTLQITNRATTLFETST